MTQLIELFFGFAFGLFVGYAFKVFKLRKEEEKLHQDMSESFESLKINLNKIF